MTFKIGEYVVHKEYPKNKVVLHLTNQSVADVINAQQENFRHATQKEIEEHSENYGNG